MNRPVLSTAFRALTLYQRPRGLLSRPSRRLQRRLVWTPACTEVPKQTSKRVRMEAWRTTETSFEISDVCTSVDHRSYYRVTGLIPLRCTGPPRGNGPRCDHQGDRGLTFWPSHGRARSTRRWEGGDLERDCFQTSAVAAHNLNVAVSRDCLKGFVVYPFFVPFVTFVVVHFPATDGSADFTVLPAISDCRRTTDRFKPFKLGETLA